MSTIVEFVGLPGVGKTTLSSAVATKLEAHDYQVTEPTASIETRPAVARLPSKMRFVLAGSLRQPRGTIKTTQAVAATNQPAVSDAVRVLFNLLYVRGVTSAYRPADGVCVLDQGIYQGLWSVGLRSPQPWSDVFARFNEQWQPIADLVVFVEASKAAVVERLRERTDGDTRFEPDAVADRGITGYEQLKSRVQAGDTTPESIVLKNQTRDDIQLNAERIVTAIQSVDD